MDNKFETYLVTIRKTGNNQSFIPRMIAVLKYVFADGQIDVVHKIEKHECNCKFENPYGDNDNV